MEKGSIEFTEYGVNVGVLVTRASLTGTVITGKGSGTGIHAKGMTGMVMTLDDVKISKVGVGVTMMEGKKLTISGGWIKGVQTGIVMMKGESLTISGDSTISFMGDYGVYVGDKVTKADLKGTVITGKGSGTGIHAKGMTGMVMTLDNVTVSKVAIGVEMMAGMLTMTKGSIDFVGDYGVKLGSSVTRADLKGTTIMGKGSGYGVYAVGGTNLEMTLEKVEIKGVEKGVYMEKGESLTIRENSRIEFKGDGVGVGVGKDVKSVNLTRTVITGIGSGMGTGIYAVGAGNGELTVALTDVTVSKVQTGVVMGKGERLTVSGSSRIEFKENGIGVGVWGEVKSVNLMGTRIMGDGKGRGTGVYVVGGTNMTMTLEGVEVSQVKMGVVVGKGENLTMEKGSIDFMGNDGVGVYLGGGVASASLMDVEIKGQNKGTGVYAMGGAGNGTLTMTLADVRISQVGKGITMVGGGDLTVTGRSTINFMGGYGVKVGGDVTADLAKVTIEGDGKGTGTGVIMESSGKMMLTEVGISKVKTGVYADNGELEIKGRTTIDFKESGWGVYVKGGIKSVSLNDVTIKGEESGYGIHAMGATGMTMTLDDVKISKIGKGVYVGGGKKLTMKGGSVDFTGSYGVGVGNTAMVELMKTRIVGKESGGSKNSGVSVGVYAVGMWNGTMMLDGVEISKVQTGVSIDGDGTLEVTVTGGMIKEVKTGIAMTGGGTLTVEKETEIQFKDGYGVMVGGVNAHLTGATITGSGSGSTGVYAMGGKVLLEKVVVEGNNQGTGLYMAQGAVRLKDTTLRDVAKGMTISEGVVHMEGGSVTFSGRYGISVSGGNALLSGFKIIRQENKGTGTVPDADADTGTVTNTVAGVGAGAGVEVSHLAKVMMKEVNIEGVKTGAYVMGKGLLVMDKGSISFKGDYGIYFDQGYAVLNDVHITGSGHKGTGIKMGDGQLLMVDTTLKEVAEGMTIVKGNVSMDKGSIEFKREHGVLLKQGSVLLNNLSMKYMGNDSDATFLKVEADSVVDKKGERVLNTADIKGIGIKIDGQDKARGVYVTNGGRVMLKSAVFSDVLNGVDVANAQFQMEDGKINFHGDHAVNLTTGNVLLKSVIIEYKGDNKLIKDADTPGFIKVEGKGANLTAIKTVISGDRWERGRGLHVAKGGHATLSQSHFTKVQSAITVKEGSVWMGSGSIKFNGEYGIKLYEGKAILEKVLMNYEGNKSADFIKAEGRESVIRVIDTIINGNDKGKGAHITKGGHVRLINSNLNKLDTGITAENAEITMSNTSMSFKGSHGVSLSVGKAILNKVGMTHTGDNDTDFLKAQGKGANLAANKITIKGSKNKGQGLHVTRGAKITLLQSDLAGIAKGIHIDSGMVNVRKSTITVEGDESCGISLWGSQKSTKKYPKRSRRSTQNNLATAHRIPEISEVGVVNLTQTILKVPNSVVIQGKTAKSFITLKDSNISGDLLLRAENGSAIMLATNNSSLTGGSHVDDESNALFYLTNKSKWFLTKRKNQNLRKSSSSISGVMLKDSAIIFEKPTSDDYQTLNIGKGYHSIYLAQGDAQLHLNIHIGQDGSLDDDKTDRVLIHGNVAGNTKIHMNTLSSNGGGAINSKTNGNNNNQSVSIVQVSGSAKKDSFRLNYGYVTLDNSPYQHHLVAYGPGAELKADPEKRLVKGDGEFWDFRLESKYIPFDPRRPSIVPIKPAIVPQVPTYLLLPNALFYTGLMDINNQTELLGTMVTSFDPFFNGKPAFFIRGYGGSHTYTSDLSALEYGYGAKFDYRAADAAVLLSTLENEQNSAFIGAIGTYGKLSLQPQDVEKSKKSNFDHWSVTAYASLQHNMGFYVNGLLSYGLSRGDVETLARGKTARITGKPLRAALTGGKAFLTGHEGLVFEPQMQLIYQYLMFNSTRDIDGFNINMGSPSQLTTRLGGRLAQEFALMEEDSSVSFYGKLHLMGNFGGKQFVQFKDTFQLGAFGSSMEAGVGVQAQLSSQIALHGDVVYQQKLTKAGFSGSTFSGGLRYRF
ncbi:hypothetical protein m07a_10250 [Bartonella schoenbuchensis m07a]|uniref:Autotransporter domain-containing protein n=2 Tax=Bartonella schoenbuchensis TaxID=165694 RepID=N6VB52_9HYPH|nr:hypothetical protein m07a_10250 [Bartonella schoenbuchensis m07a]